ncbi:hypothetical protein MTO96_041593 [Rhipicephalus appendiculatus]
MTFAFNLLSLFAVTLLIAGVREPLGFSGYVWLFRAVDLAGTLLVYWLVPETRGRSLEQILMDATVEGDDFRCL